MRSNDITAIGALLVDWNALMRAWLQTGILSKARIEMKLKQGTKVRGQEFHGMCFG
ncbi:hypothetical protein V512_009620 [Mesotoga sp. Brook.08.105.5.1]|nr:hypothetical protein V512_009620 [Mesotoga sp. Brook.08.105.5.1]